MAKTTQEQIPDLTAYRLVFTVISTPAHPTKERRQHQTMLLAKMQLASSDSAVALRALSIFNEKYSKLTEQYNDSVQLALAANSDPDANSFLRSRDSLVQQTINDLRSTLTPDGFLRFAVFVRSEKAHMQIAINDSMAEAR